MPRLRRPQLGLEPEPEASGDNLAEIALLKVRSRFLLLLFNFTPNNTDLVFSQFSSYIINYTPNMHMAHSQELEAASRSSETYLAENGGGRPASVQPRSCTRVQEGTGQNYLARTHGNGYVTDKPRMMMMMIVGYLGIK